MSAADVTILIPAFRAQAFVHRAIESALAQTHPAVRILVRVDPGGDETETVCRQYVGDPRLSVRVNAERLGWIGNVNACLGEVETPFFGFCFHDDTLYPDWAAVLRRALTRDPQAIAASGALEHVEASDGSHKLLRPESLRGGPADRAVKILSETAIGYNLKGLLRSDPVRRGLRLPELAASGYQADWHFFLAYALEGESIAVCETLYRKTFWSGSVTSGWRAATPADLSRAEVELKGAMMSLVRDHPSLGAVDRMRVYQAILSRPPLRTAPACWSADASLFAHADHAWLASGLTALFERLLSGNAFTDAPPADPDSEARRGRDLFRRAQRAAEADDVVTAIYEMRRAHALAPQDARIARALARLLNRRGARPLARQGEITRCLECALELSPRWHDWQLLAHVRLREGDHAAALSAAEEAQRLSPAGEDGPRLLLQRLRDGMRGDGVSERVARG